MISLIRLNLIFLEFIQHTFREYLPSGRHTVLVALENTMKQRGVGGPLRSSLKIK